MDKIDQYSSIGRMPARQRDASRADSSKTFGSERSFKEVLGAVQEERTEGLKFSKHANERLANRNINLSAEQMERLENGTTKAREKGIRESLVMVDDLAFIVNVKNNTVVTAMGDSTDSIFTNIDGAVIG